MDAAWIKTYNEWEHKRWSGEFERSIDAMALIALDMQTSGNAMCLNPNLINFFVHVPNQPQCVSDLIKKHGFIPDGYNNIATFYPGQKTWSLKFSPNA